MRRIGVLLPAAADDAEFQARVGAFLQGLQQLDWTIGRNVRIDTRWATANAAEIRRHAAELAALAPDVILAHGASTVGPLLQATRSVPIVFVDRRRSGRWRLGRKPGAAGRQRHRFHEFRIQHQREMAGAAQADRAKRDASGGPSGCQPRLRNRPVCVIQAVAPSLRVEVNPVNMRDASEIERTVTAFARSPNGGLIVTAGAPAIAHRDLIVMLAARHKLPAVYSSRYFVAGGGLISYGPDLIDQYRRAADYVDRILKGEKPADLPVQAPTKYETGDQPQDRQGARPRNSADRCSPAPTR